MKENLDTVDKNCSTESGITFYEINKCKVNSLTLASHTLQNFVKVSILGSFIRENREFFDKYRLIIYIDEIGQKNF